MKRTLLAALTLLMSSPFLSQADEHYAPPFWLAGGHLQTIVPFVLGTAPGDTYQRERWELADGDFVDADWVIGQQTMRAEASATNSIPDLKHETRPVVMMFHGLEGSSQSNYALALMAEVERRGWIGVVVHFRGCSGEPNRLPRVYYAGDTAEIQRFVEQVKTRVPQAPLYLVGYSLGGNALLKWLGEHATQAHSLVSKAAAVSAPMDLAASSKALEGGLNRVLYGPVFVSSMRTKALDFAKRFPGLLDLDAVREAQTIWDMDEAITAVLYGAEDATDYYAQNASKPWLSAIQVPALIINARNDPFVPAASLPGPDDVSAQVTLEYLNAGGHVGFSGSWLGNDISWLPQRILDYFEEEQAGS